MPPRSSTGFARLRRFAAILAFGAAPLAGCRDASPEAVTKSLQQMMVRREPDWAEHAPWTAVQRAYRDREYRPVWLDGGGYSGQRARDLADALCHAERQGLRRSNYDLAGLHGALERAYTNGRPDADEATEVDVRLTALFLDYGADLLAGRIDPSAADTSRFTRARRGTMDSLLRVALAKSDFAGMLDELEPAQRGYDELVDALAEYRRIAERGGWRTVPGEGPVGPGSDGRRIQAVRDRLAGTGDLRGARERDYYDEGLRGAVVRFQARHGIAADGLVGRGTLAALNVPVEARIKQIELNLDRWRRLPARLGERYLLVNLPEHRLFAFDGGRERFSLRVAVGDEYGRDTPVFADSLSHLVFQPAWNVPERVVKEELLPRVRDDMYYLADNHYEVVDSGRGRRVLDPLTVNWSQVDTSRLTFGLRQRPGDGNPLGRVKFMFPNQVDVYLHDGPSRDVFRRGAARGCVRVENPERLAAYALAGDTAWSGRAIRQAMTVPDSSGWNRRVDLERKVPAFIVYLTAFVRDGQVNFRDDASGMDERGLTRIGSAAGRGTICERLRRLMAGDG